MGLLFGYFVGITLCYLFIGVLVFYSGARFDGLKWFFGSAIALGWIPILIRATDPEGFIAMNDGIVGLAACFALVLYTYASLGILYLMIFRPDPNFFPLLKGGGVSLVYPNSPTVDDLKQGGYVNADSLRPKEGLFSGFAWWERASARATRAKAEALKAQTENLRASENLSRWAKNYNEEKARDDVARKRRKT